MYRIDYSSLYKKTFKKLSIDDKLLVLEVIDILASGQKLNIKYQDHKLKGNMSGYRECHIKPDLLLVYKKDEDILVLTCVKLTNHNNLSKK